MTSKKNKYSQFMAVKTYKGKKYKTVYFLSNKDIEQGQDIKLDFLGFNITAL